MDTLEKICELFEIDHDELIEFLTDEYEKEYQNTWRLFREPDCNCPACVAYRLSEMKHLVGTGK